MADTEAAPSVSKEIVINATPQDTRVALLENKVLTELYIEHVKDRRVVGNIYKGRVVRVLPGMQAAFVDIGLEKAAFLYVSDVYSDQREYEELFGLEEDADDVPLRPSKPAAPIEDLLHEGQEILVQVAKEPLGRKGARITQYVSLPGRHVVYLPHVSHVGVSRRITDDAERARLREVVTGLRTGPGGFIVRTAAEGCTEDDIRPEMEFLTRLWNDIVERSARVSAPNLLHCDLDISFRAIRDLYTPEVKRIVVDSAEEYKKILDFVTTYVPKARPLVELYNRPEPIFNFYDIEIEISKALERRVWLKSGGYIVIERTEALTAIDVNTGSYVGKRNLEETILKTNLEAAREIAYQLRLRNIGGIIIIDFIDMEVEENRRKVFETLEAELKKDRAKTNLLEISSLGLVEMTRKRVHEDLGRMLCEPCPYCEGKGYVRSRATVAYDVFREIRRRRHHIVSDTIVVEAHPEVVHYLYDEERTGLEALEKTLGKQIVLKARPGLHQEEFRIADGKG
ncbi:MAG: Rne/Rng family ribonuclease [Candidatus Dadabacteria bacterium]|nr:MAG: Rne/Rng family ribonuclease [Candidatus Dadabacteria bacterium]